MKKSQARLQAILEGRTSYVPEMPCARGHRLRSISGTCYECRKLQEKKKYYENLELTKQKVKAKYHKNAEKIKARRRESYQKNKEQEKAIAKVRSAEWRLKNPNHANTKLVKIKWKKNNLGKVNAETAKRRLAKLQRTPKWLTDDNYWIMEQAYELAALRTKMLGFSWHVDHVIPLQGKTVSGLHVPTNLQVIPATENLRKAYKYLPA